MHGRHRKPLKYPAIRWAMGQTLIWGSFGGVLYIGYLALRNLI